MFEELLKLDLEVDGIENLTEEEENDYFALLNGDNVGKAITNMAEYLLMTQAMKGEIKVSFISLTRLIMLLALITNFCFLWKNAAFWFRLGLKYYERSKPEEIDRHLIMLALFYATRDKRMMAEGLYR